ncbi:MAG: EAL domain-containing protein [Solirubrobacteraceae bacterium]
MPSRLPHARSLLATLSAHLAGSFEVRDGAEAERTLIDAATLGLSAADLSALVSASACDEQPGRPGLDEIADRIMPRLECLRTLRVAAGALSTEPVLSLERGSLLYERALAERTPTSVRPADFDGARSAIEARASAERLAHALDALDRGVLPGRLAVELSAPSGATGSIEKAGADGLIVLCSEATLDRRPGAVRRLHTEARGHGWACGITEFGEAGGGLLRLRGLRLDYLELACEVTARVAVDPDLQATVYGICAVARRQGTSVIATGVTSEATLATLAGLGVDGACGAAVAASRPLAEFMAESEPGDRRTPAA